VSDINSNIRIEFDTGTALAQLRNLQAGLSKFHQTLAEGNLAAANAQKGLTASMIQSINATGKFYASQKTVATSTQAFTTALEKNQLSLKEYFRYSAAAATANTKILTKAFAAEREILNRARRDRVKALQSQYIQLNGATGAFAKTIQIMPKSLAMVNGKFTELGTRIQYAAQRQQFLNQLLKQGSTQLLNFGKNMQWAGRQLMVGLTMPLGMLAGAAAKAFKELEKETVAFRRVYGDMFTSDAETDAAIENIKKIGMEYTKFGIAVKDTMNMAASAAAAGFSGTALENQVKQANKLAVLGQIDQQKALETTISLQNAFGISSDELAKKINFLNAVENQTVVSLDDITTAIPKVAPVIKQLGGSVEDLAFFLTAMEEGGVNASEGANALKSGLAALINPGDKASTMLAGLGINIKGIVEANAGDLKGTVVGFARALDTLAPLQRARAIEQLFGKFQFARLSTLFQNVTKDGSQASRTLQLAGASVEELSILSQREMSKVEDSVGVKFQKAIEQFKVTLMPIGKQFLEAVTPVVEFFGKMLEKFNGLGDGTKKVIGILVAALGFIGPAALMAFGLLANGAANVIKFFAMLRGGIAKLNGQTNVLGAGFDYLTQQETENLAQSNALHTSHQRLISVFNVEKGSVDSLASSYANAATQARSLATSSPGLFAAPGAASAVSKLPRKVGKYADGILSVPGPKGAGDIQPAMLSPGESVIPTKQSIKHRGLIKAIMSDSVPGHMAGRIGKIKPQSSREPLFLGMPKTLKETHIRIANQKMLDDMDRAIRTGPLGALEPSNFGKLVTETTGHSFPIPGVGGIYEKGGKQLFVKPVTDIDAARAELLSTSTFTPAHNLIAPKQELRTMLDPTDPKGKRRIAVLVSPYDAKFANPDGKFTQQQMADQLYASSLRGDKDLQTANVSGNMVIDAGTSYAYDKASGLRTQSDSLKSVLEQAHINTLGVKGGARRAFADAVAPIAQKMTADEFHILMSGTVTAHNARLASTLATTKLTAAEKEFYAKNILARGKEAEDIDWRQIHANLVNLEPAAKKKELTAAAIAKKFEEQLLKKRQSGHANEDFYVQPFDDGTGGVGKSKASLDRIKALPIIDSHSQQEQHRIFQWAEDQMSAPGIRPEAKAKWDKSKEKWKKGIAQYLTYDPATGLYYTGKEGERGTPRDHLERALKYSLGIEPATTAARKGQFASINDTATANHALAKISIGGATKGGGGVATNNPGAKALLDKIRLETEARNKALGASGETTKLTEYLKSKYPDATTGQIKRLLQLEAAHIEPGKAAQGEQSIARKRDKWITGQAWDDFGAVNQYMLNDKKTQRILDWDKSFPESPLGLNDKRRAEYQKAADFMASGRHPSTAEEAKLVRDAAQLELLAIEAEEKSKKATGKKPKGFSKYKLNLNKLSADAARFILDGRLGPDSSFYDDLLTQKKIVNLDTNTRTGQISVGKGEGIIPADTKPGSKVKPEKVTGQNSTPRPFGSTTTGPSGERVPKKPGLVASRQTMQFIGKDAGDLTFRNDPTYSPAFTEASDLSKNSQRNINKLVNEHINNLKKTNTLSKDDIRAKADNYRRYLIADRLEKANQAEYAKTAPARAKLAAQNLKKEQANARKERVGRFSGGASAAVGGLGMAAMMGGADQKVTTGLFAASAVAGLAPMLMNPYVAAGAAVLAVAGTFWYVNKKAKEAAENQSRLVDATRATTEKMKTIGEMNVKVGASEIMKQRREDTGSDRYLGKARGKAQYGATFLEQDVGKGMIENINKSLVSGSKNTAKQVAVELAGYISDGVLSAEQAHSIADQIGINLGDSSLGMRISGTLLDLVGPNGEDLLKDPLNVRLSLVKEQQSLTNDFNQILKDFAVGSDEYVSNDQAKTVAAAAAAAGVQSLEFNQAQIDSLDVQYDKQIKILETQRLATSDKAKQVELDGKIKDLKDKQSSGTAALRLNNKKVLDDQIKTLKLIQDSKGDGYKGVETAFFDSLNAQVEAKYADDPTQTAFLKGFFEKSKGISQDLEIKIKTIVGAGQLKPNASIKLLDMFAGDEGRLRKTLNIMTRMQDPGKVQELLSFLGPIGDPAIRKTIFTSIISEDAEKSDSLVATLKLMAEMQGKEFNIKTYFEDPEAIEKLGKLAAKMEEVEQKDVINPKVIATIDVDDNTTNGNGMQGLLDEWHKYANLPDETRKAVVQQYITAYSTITEGEIDAEIKRTNAAAKAKGGVGATFPIIGGTKEQRDAAAQRVAERKVYEQRQTDIAAAKLRAAELAKKRTGGADKYSEINDLLKQIKFLRDASVDAEGKLKELSRITAGEGITKITGVIQQLMKGPKGGYNRDFISWLESMDEATRKTYMSVNKAGKVILSTEGKQAKELFNEASFGRAYNRENTVAQDSLAQAAALVKLKAAGFDTAKALELVADASFAVSVNSGNITPEELKLLKEEAIRAKKEVAALALELKNAASGSQQGLADITQKLKILSGLKDRYKLTSDQREAIVSQSKGTLDSLEGYLAGKITGPAGDAIKKDLETLLKDVHPTIDGTLNLKIATNGLEAARDAFSDIQNRFNDFFNAKRSLVASKYRDKLSAAQREVDPNVKGTAGANAKAAQDELTAAQKAVDAANRANDKKVKTINDNAEKELRALEKTVKEKKDALDKANKDLKAAEDKANIEQDRYNVQMEYDSYFAADGTVNDGFTKNAKTGVTNPRSIEFLQRNIDTNQRELEKKVNRPLEDAQKSLAAFERNMQTTYTDRIDALQETSSAYSDDLTVIDHAAEAINKKYDLQEEALNKISAINDQIISQQKDQLDLASAISSGDIGAAAKAMQQIQASRVSGMAKTQQDAIDAARKSEVDGLKSSSGMTRAEIEAEQYRISREIVQIEKNSLPLQKNIKIVKEQIYDLEQKRETYLKGIRLLEDEIYDKTLARQVALDAITKKEIALKPLQDAATAAQKAYDTAEEDYNTVVEDRDAALKALEQTHTDAMVALETRLTAAEDALIIANDALAAAQAAVDEIQGKIDEELGKITEMENQFLAVQDAIFGMTSNLFDFTTELEAALLAAENLAAELAKDAKEKKDLKDAAPGLAKEKLDAAMKAEKELEDSIAKTQEFIANLQDKAGELSFEEFYGLDKAMKAIPELMSKLKDLKIATAEAQAAYDKLTIKKVPIGVIPLTLAEKRDEARAKNPSLPNYLLNQMYPDLAPFATGGMVPKAYADERFAMGTDTVPAMLTPGEFVIRKAAVDKYGVDTFKDLNMQRFATGGEVTGGNKPKNKNKDGNWFSRFNPANAISSMLSGMFNFGVSQQIHKDLNIQSTMTQQEKDRALLQTAQILSGYTSAFNLKNNTSPEIFGNKKLGALADILGVLPAVGLASKIATKNPIVKPKVETFKILKNATHASWSDNLAGQTLDPLNWKSGKADSMGRLNYLGTKETFESAGENVYKLSLFSLLKASSGKGLIKASDFQKEFGAYPGGVKPDSDIWKAFLDSKYTGVLGDIVNEVGLKMPIKYTPVKLAPRVIPEDLERIDIGEFLDSYTAASKVIPETPTAKPNLTSEQLSFRIADTDAAAIEAIIKADASSMSVPNTGHSFNPNMAQAGLNYLKSGKIDKGPGSDSLPYTAQIWEFIQSQRELLLKAKYPEVDFSNIKAFNEVYAKEFYGLNSDQSIKLFKGVMSTGPLPGSAYAPSWRTGEDQLATYFSSNPYIAAQYARMVGQVPAGVKELPLFSMDVPIKDLKSYLGEGAIRNSNAQGSFEFPQLINGPDLAANTPKIYNIPEEVYDEMYNSAGIVKKQWPYGFASGFKSDVPTITPTAKSMLDSDTLSSLSPDTLHSINLWKTGIDRYKADIADLKAGKYLSPGTGKPVVGDEAQRLIEVFENSIKNQLKDIEIALKNDIPPGVLDTLRTYTRTPTMAHQSGQPTMQQVASIRTIGEDQVVYRGLSDKDMSEIVGYQPGKSWSDLASPLKENFGELITTAKAEGTYVEGTMDYKDLLPGIKIGESWVPDVVKSTTDSLDWAKKIAVSDFTGGGNAGAVAKIFVDKDVLGFPNLMDLDMGGTVADLLAKEQLLAPFTEYVLKEFNPLALKVPATGNQTSSKLLDEYVFEAKQTLPVPYVRISDQIEYPEMGTKPNVPSTIANDLPEPPKIIKSTISAGKLKQLKKFINPDLMMASGGLVPGLGNKDSVSAMLTPGEFVMTKYAVANNGLDTMRAINNGDPVGNESVYNYSVNVNVKSDANPDEIARAVMMQIKQVDGQKIRGNRF
jgi:TP901 family phage tail tape measure protein